MGSLEDKEIAATNKVVKKLNAQAKRIQAWLPTGNPTMVGRINAAIIWVFVSRTLLENLAIAANGKALSAVTAGAIFVRRSRQLSRTKGRCMLRLRPRTERNKCCRKASRTS